MNAILKHYSNSIIIHGFALMQWGKNLRSSLLQLGMIKKFCSGPGLTQVLGLVYRPTGWQTRLHQHLNRPDHLRAGIKSRVFMYALYIMQRTWQD